MDTLRKVLLAFGALGVVMVLAAGPALATEAGGGETGGSQPGGTETTTEDGAGEGGGHGGEGLVVRNDEGKMILPLDPSRPRDAVGWGLVAVLTLAILAGLANAVKQLRGERPQASGEWRYR